MIAYSAFAIWLARYLHTNGELISCQFQYIARLFFATLAACFDRVKLSSPSEASHLLSLVEGLRRCGVRPFFHPPLRF